MTQGRIQTVAKYAYTTVPGKISILFEKIRKSGIPPVADNDWLMKVSLTDSNDPTLLTVLRFLHFIDQSGEPTEVWANYLGAAPRKVLANAIRKAYGGLFQQFKNPYDYKTKDLVNFFRGETKASEAVAGRMATTFRNLCKLADFGEHAGGVVSAGKTGDGLSVNAGEGTGRVPVQVTVNVNLPETTDEKVYRNFFTALKETLLEDN